MIKIGTFIGFCIGVLISTIVKSVIPNILAIFRLKQGVDIFETIFKYKSSGFIKFLDFTGLSIIYYSKVCQIVLIFFKAVLLLGCILIFILALLFGGTSYGELLNTII